MMNKLNVYWTVISEIADVIVFFNLFIHRQIELNPCETTYK